MVAAIVQIEWFYHIYFSTNTSQNNSLTFIILSWVFFLHNVQHYKIFTGWVPLHAYLQTVKERQLEQNHEGLDAMRSWMLQPRSRKAKALAMLKPVSPSFDFNNMLKYFFSRGQGPSVASRALHSLCCLKPCSEAAAKWSCCGNISSGFLNRTTEKLKLRMRVYPRFYTKLCALQRIIWRA